MQGSSIYYYISKHLWPARLSAKVIGSMAKEVEGAMGKLTLGVSKHANVNSGLHISDR